MIVFRITIWVDLWKWYDHGSSPFRTLKAVRVGGCWGSLFTGRMNRRSHVSDIRSKRLEATFKPKAEAHV